MNQPRKERILNLIKKKKVDRLPSDIWLSNRAKDKLLQELKVQGLFHGYRCKMCYFCDIAI